MLNDKSKINKNTPVPLYFQLKTLILDEIKSGRYKVGDAIPTEKELSEMFEISRTTVRQAVMELVQEGWLYREKSKGTFVAQPKIRQDFIQKIESFNDQITRSGMTPSTEVLALKTEKAGPEVAEQLKLKEGDKVVFLFRNRCADGMPIVITKTYLPYAKCSFLMEGHDLTKERLYHILGVSADTAIVKIERTVEAVAANEEDAKLLDYTVGAPIQYFHSTGYTINEEPLEYSIARYRGDRNSFQIVIYNSDD